MKTRCVCSRGSPPLCARARPRHDLICDSCWRPPPLQPYTNGGSEPGPTARVDVTKMKVSSRGRRRAGEPHAPCTAPPLPPRCRDGSAPTQSLLCPLCAGGHAAQILQGVQPFRHPPAEQQGRPGRGSQQALEFCGASACRRGRRLQPGPRLHRAHLPAAAVLTFRPRPPLPRRALARSRCCRTCCGCGGAGDPRPRSSVCFVRRSVSSSASHGAAGLRPAALVKTSVVARANRQCRAGGAPGSEARAPAAAKAQAAQHRQQLLPRNELPAAAKRRQLSLHLGGGRVP